MNLLRRPPTERRPAARPVGGQRSGAWTVDRALRLLAIACAEQDRPLPAVAAVVLGPDTVSVRLGTPDRTPPPGWTAEPGGRTWQAPMQRLQTAAVDIRLPAPFPLLVSVGQVRSGRLLLNLAEAGGLVGLVGDDALARGLAESWSRRLAKSPWTAEAQIIRVGFDVDPEFRGLTVSQLALASPLLVRPEGGVVFFAERPDPSETHRVDRLLAEPPRRWAVVVVGAESARWRLTLDLSGTIDTGLLAEPVHPPS